MLRQFEEFVRAVKLRFRIQHVSLPNRLRVGRAIQVSVSDGGRWTTANSLNINDFAKIIVKSGSLQIGSNAHIGIGSIIVVRDSITIGDDVLIAEYVTIRDQDHRFGGPEPTARNGFDTAPIVIGNNVWIGAKATITKGVTIGDNSVIGANSVVTRDIPANVVAAGVPARVIRSIAPKPEAGGEEATVD